MNLADARPLVDSFKGVEVLYKGKVMHFINDAGDLSSDSRFYCAGFEFGPSWVIHVQAYSGDGFEEAYELWVDELPEIDRDDYTEAYAVPGDEDGRSFYELACSQIEAPAVNYPWEEHRAKRLSLARELLDAAVEKAREGDGDYPEIIERYREDSSGRVKNLGHYECFFEADDEDISFVAKCGHTDCAESPHLATACLESKAG